MRMQMFSVYDKAVGCYMQPFFTRSKGEAIRSFSDACSDNNTNFCKHPEDFVLFFIGEYDEDDGCLFSPSSPDKVISAIECTRPEFASDRVVRVPNLSAVESAIMRSSNGG